MTGTIDLSAEQFQTISRRINFDFGDIDRSLIRVVIHPAPDQAVRVVTYENALGDVLQGHFYILRNGVLQTGKEFNEYHGPSYADGN